jgi:hypothetical protein
MSTPSSAQALENIYAALLADNEGIDERIAELKAALAAEGKKPAVAVDPTRLAQNNRQGRKMMMSYFKKRGLDVSFGD